VPGIEPGPPDLWPRTLTTRPQRRSLNASTSLNIKTTHDRTSVISEPVIARGYSTVNRKGGGGEGGGHGISRSDMSNFLTNNAQNVGQNSGCWIWVTIRM
jgi:hypothetical protein